MNGATVYPENKNEHINSRAVAVAVVVVVGVRVGVGVGVAVVVGFVVAVAVAVITTARGPPFNGEDMIKAEVDTDPQHGPIVRVTVDGTTVAVYLRNETAVVTNERGQCGLEVKGLWLKFKADTKIILGE